MPANPSKPSLAKSASQLQAPVSAWSPHTRVMDPKAPARLAFDSGVWYSPEMSEVDIEVTVMT